MDDDALRLEPANARFGPEARERDLLLFLNEGGRVGMHVDRLRSARN